MRIPLGVRRAFRLPATSERIARELDDEVRFHVEMRAKALIAQGFSSEQAYAEALRRFGDVDDLRDYCVSIEVAHMQRVQFRERFDTILQDLRFAFRQYRKSPGFAFVAALTLALGVGATTAIFSVLNGVVLRPLPFRNSEQMVQISGIDAKGGSLNTLADPTFDEIATQSRTLSAVAEYQRQPVPFLIGDEPTVLPGAVVSRGFFDVLGVKPAAGRFFAPEEQQLGAPVAAVISQALFERQFGSSPGTLGRRVMMGSTQVTIVGVLPAGKEFPAETQVFLARETRQKRPSYTAHNWWIIGRVRDGITVQQASTEVSAILRGLHQRVGDATWTFDGVAVTIREKLIGKIKPLLMMLFGASGVLLLIACANVANLLIARMAARDNEIAVRLAIGAGRARLVQQLVIEASLLAAIGCAGGLALAYAGVKVLLALKPALIPRVTELGIDSRALAFAVAVSAGTAIALGLIAAWRGARGDLRAALSQGQRTQGGAASYRIRGSLVVLQIAMTVVLLIGAGLLARSFVHLVTIDAGFHTKGVVVATVGYEGGGDEAGRVARRVQRHEDIMARALALPGVTAAGTADSPPFSAGSSNGAFLVLSGIDVKLDPASLEPMFRDKARVGFANYWAVSSSYFKALGIPLVAGRMLTDGDRSGAPHVAVINAALAKKQWPAGDAIGKIVEFGNIDGDLTPITIVGIVGDTREQTLAGEPPATIYVPYLQRGGNGSYLTAVMATNNETATIATARQAFRQVAPGVPIRFTTIEEIIGRSVATQRFMLLLVGVFAGVALLLATLGVYSVVSYLVAQRGREISIRVALGARGADILRLVLAQGMTLAIMGAVVGGVAAFGATRVLKNLLYEISTTDPIAFASVLATLCAVALVASWLPARRAARAEPMDVLRGG